MNNQTYGENTIDSLKRLNQNIVSSKTPTTLEVQDLPESYKISGRAGIMLSGKLYPAMVRVPHINGKEFISWHGGRTYPTPTRFDAGRPILKPRKLNPSGGQKPNLKETLCSKKSHRLCPYFVSMLMGYPRTWLETTKKE